MLLFFFCIFCFLLLILFLRKGNFQIRVENFAKQSNPKETKKSETLKIGILLGEKLKLR